MSDPLNLGNPGYSGSGFARKGKRQEGTCDS
jgi:hypothetical protein